MCIGPAQGAISPVHMNGWNIPFRTDRAAHQFFGRGRDGSREPSPAQIGRGRDGSGEPPPHRSGRAALPHRRGVLRDPAHADRPRPPEEGGLVSRVADSLAGLLPRCGPANPGKSELCLPRGKTRSILYLFVRPLAGKGKERGWRDLIARSRRAHEFAAHDTSSWTRT